jgi:cardiolipin synthase
MSYLRSATSSVYSARNQVELVQGGHDYFSRLIGLINSATTSFHLQVYIYDSDETGILVGNALQAAARRGVNVYLLLDGYASQNLSEEFRLSLQNSGVNFRWFKPIFKSKSFYFGRRLHHKIAVADGSRALVGGINISNRYNDLPDQPAWLDWAVEVSGESAEQLNRLCVSFWNRAIFQSGRKADMTPLRKDMITEAECLVRVRRNDWVNRKVEISRSYLEMMKRAEKEIIILCSYFLPGSMIRNALSKAVRRGLKITVIIASDSDVSLTKAAEKYWYPWLLRHHIRIYEYQPTVLHGKLAVFDKKWVTIGSYNINNISAYASVELNLDIKNDEFGRKTADALEHIIEKHCIEITADRFKRSNNLFLRWWYWMSYEIYRLILFLFTFYFRQRKRER